MNRRAIIIAASIIAAGIVFMLASASGGRSGAPQRSACNFMFSMPASNIAAASQTNISPQIK